MSTYPRVECPGCGRTVAAAIDQFYVNPFGEQVGSLWRHNRPDGGRCERERIFIPIAKEDPADQTTPLIVNLVPVNSWGASLANVSRSGGSSRRGGGFMADREAVTALRGQGEAAARRSDRSGAAFRPAVRSDSELTRPGQLSGIARTVHRRYAHVRLGDRYDLSTATQVESARVVYEPGVTNSR